MTDNSHKTPREIAKELWVSTSSCHCTDSVQCSIDNPCEYCLTNIAEIEAALAAERQKRCSNCECHTMEICIRCATTMKKKIASLEQELAEANKTLKMNYQSIISMDKQLRELTAENERLRTEIAELRNDNECLQGLRDKEECYKQSEKYAFEAIGLRERIKALEGALREVQELADDEADITDNGGPNTAMKIGGIIHAALTSPKAPEKSDYSAKCAFCGGRTFLSPEEIHEPIFVCSCDGGPKSGDSAGPEKHDKDIERIAFHYAYYDEIEAVIEAARNMMKVDPSLLNNSLGSAYAIKHYCEVRQALEALDRARREGKSDGH